MGISGAELKRMSDLAAAGVDPNFQAPAGTWGGDPIFIRGVRQPLGPAAQGNGFAVGRGRTIVCGVDVKAVGGDMQELAPVS